MNIIFICTGNTCRSPMAEAYFKQLVEKKKLSDKINVFSAGTMTLDKRPISENSRKVLEEQKIETKELISTPLSQELLLKMDMIVPLADSHYYFITEDYHFANSAIVRLKDKKGKIISITDPFGGDLNTYRQCFYEIKNALNRLFEEKIITKNNKRETVNGT